MPGVQKWAGTKTCTERHFPQPQIKFIRFEWAPNQSLASKSKFSRRQLIFGVKVEFSMSHTNFWRQIKFFTSRTKSNSSRPQPIFGVKIVFVASHTNVWRQIKFFASQTNVWRQNQIFRVPSQFSATKLNVSHPKPIFGIKIEFSVSQTNFGRQN